MPANLTEPRYLILDRDTKYREALRSLIEREGIEVIRLPPRSSVVRSFTLIVTEHPTFRWVAQQMVEAFPWNNAPRYLLRDRDAIYGERFCRRVQSLLIEEVITAPRSPWQNPYVERIIGSIRRDCLDHLIVLNERHLKRILKSYFEYYHWWRTHLGLEMDTPQGPERSDTRQGRGHRNC